MEKFGGFRALKSIAKSLHYQPKRSKVKSTFWFHFFRQKLSQNQVLLFSILLQLGRQTTHKKIDGINVL